MAVRVAGLRVVAAHHMSRWKLAVSMSSNSLQGTSGMLLLQQHPGKWQQAGRTTGDDSQAGGDPKTTLHSLGKSWESPERLLLLLFTSLDLLHRSDQKPGKPQWALPWEFLVGVSSETSPLSSPQ